MSLWTSEIDGNATRRGAGWRSCISWAAVEESVGGSSSKAAHALDSSPFFARIVTLGVSFSVSRHRRWWFLARGEGEGSLLRLDGVRGHCKRGGGGREGRGPVCVWTGSAATATGSS